MSNNIPSSVFSAAAMPGLLITQPKYQTLHMKRIDAINARVTELAERAATLDINSPEREGIEHQAWCLNRYKGISGTAASVIMGHNAYRTRYNYFNTITGRVLPDNTTSRFAHWGHNLESVVAEEYKRLSGNNIMEVSTMISPLFPFMSASVDRIIVDSNMTAAGILEVKTAGFATPAWGAGNKYITIRNIDGTSSRQLVEADDQVPAAYRDQVMHYMIAYGIYKATLVALIGGNDYREYTIEFDREYAEELIRAEDEFYCKHVLEDIAPAIAAADADEMVPVKGAQVEATSDIAAKLNEYASMLQSIKELTAQADQLKDDIKAFAGDNEDITIQGKVAARYAMITRKGSLDTKALEIDMPEVVDRYRKPSTSYRSLTVKL